MAKYRTTEAAAGQGIFLAVNLHGQLLPDSYEYMLNEIAGTKIDLSVFDKGDMEIHWAAIADFISWVLAAEIKF
jgi:hypothetical protein